MKRNPGCTSPLRYRDGVDTARAVGQNARFQKPPVQHVSFSVYFDAIEGLQVSHFSSLRESWRDEYPETAEMPPLRPHNRGGEEVTVVPITQAWPFPYLMFSTADDRRTIAVQNDRFTLTWKFSPSTHDYPGFDELSRLMGSRFDQFSAVISKEVGQEVSLRGSGCVYRNFLGGWTTETLMLGIVTRWSDKVSHQPQSIETEYAGLRLISMDPEPTTGGECVTTVSLDVDEDGPYLTLEAEYANTEAEVISERLGGIDMAHERLIARFLEFTSPDMHEQWGVQA